jgi:hypothetical protein
MEESSLDVNDQAVLDQLIWVVRWLAADPMKALSAVPEPWMAPEEIANDLDQHLRVVASMGLLPQETLEALVAIDESFARMTDASDDSLWSPEALASHATWAQLREEARVALRLIGAERADDELWRVV